MLTFSLQERSLADARKAPPCVYLFTTMPARASNPDLEAPIPGGQWSLYCAIIASFGFAGFYHADLTEPWIPGWLSVGIMILPVTILVMVPWGELPDRVVMIAHSFAATLFVAMALGMEIGHALGYRPEGSTFFRILAHLGWTFTWVAVIRRIRYVRQLRRQSQS